MLVSVFIPTRNRVASLKRAVESVLNQRHGDVELIVVNDGSTDDTARYLSEFGRQDARLRWIINERSLGAPTSRNAAIEAATGEFVTGLDDDDTFSPDRLSSFVEDWQRRQREGDVVSGLYSQDLIRDRLGRTTITTKPAYATAADLLKSNTLGNQIFAPKKAFLAAGLFDPKLPAWQDLEFAIRFLMVNGRAGLVPAATYQYDNMERSDRISTNARKVRLACQRVSEKHGRLEPDGAKNLVLQMIRNYGLFPGLVETRILGTSLFKASTLGLIARAGAKTVVRGARSVAAKAA